MPYYRRPYKRARYGKKLKYSVQQKAVEFSTGSDDATAKVEVVPASEIEGMRKVKHLTVSCSAEVDTGVFLLGSRVCSSGDYSGQHHGQHRDWDRWDV